MDFSSFDLQTGLTVEVVVSVNLSRKLVDAIYTKRPDFLDSEGARDWDKVTELFYKAFREHNFDSTGAVQLGTEFYLEFSAPDYSNNPDAAQELARDIARQVLADL